MPARAGARYVTGYGWMLRGRCRKAISCAVSAIAVDCAHVARYALVKTESGRARVIVQSFVLDHQLQWHSLREAVFALIEGAAKLLRLHPKVRHILSDWGTVTDSLLIYISFIKV